DTKLLVASVDATSSWDVEGGPPASRLGSSFVPTALVSLTAPKATSEAIRVVQQPLSPETDS
ncbi:hypothetical protein IWW34DRAFT_635191, partial [Fusarium oxysporum f. sp. albedinis]